MTLKRRLAGAFGASLLGPLVTTLVQLVNVPVMLRVWGAHLFGEWLLLSTIPAYLLLTDFGFASISGSDMTIRVHAGDQKGAIETFQSTAALVLLISLAICVLLIPVIFLLPIHQLLHFSSMSPGETRLTLLFLTLNCLVMLQWGVFGAVLRCAGKYALYAFIVSILRILEGVSFLVLLVWHAGPVQLSMLSLVISIAGTIWLLIIKMNQVAWIPMGVRHAKWGRIRELWNPALAFMAFPFGDAISLQGMTMMVGILMGPLAVAVFNPMRTLSRPVIQIAYSVKNSVWQELSAAYGQHDWALARKLHRSACQVSLLLALPCTIALIVAGPRIFAIWTHGRLVMDVPCFDFLMAVVLLNSLWNASSAVPLAANKHQGIAMAYLFSTGASLALGYPLIRYLGLRGAGCALLLSEVCMCIYVVPASIKLLSDRWPLFAISMIDTSQIINLQTKLFGRRRRTESADHSVSPRNT
jgi:O-antigen/teichoic acid export membrane protein